MKRYSIKPNEENFAEMLEQSFTDNESLKPGQEVETTVVSISGDYIFLDLGGKSEGILEAEELKDAEGNLTVSEGDTLKAYFSHARSGEMYFTKKISGDKAGLAALESAYKNGIPVEGTVEKEIKGGFEVKLGDSRAFCPFSQMGLKRVEDAKEYVGKRLTFKVMEYSEKGRNILISNRAILQEEQDAQKEVLKQELKENMIVKGTVISLQDFGAFVNVQGLQTMLPISEISRERVEDIHSVLKSGQEIEAKIINLDWKKDRITLSMKALQADPWDTAATKYKEGSKHKGTIARLMAFGAFVTLEPGLDGLVHISDLDSDGRIKHPQEVVQPGQEITVSINSVDVKNKRISLKQASKFESSEEYNKYMDIEEETYNPFKALLKDKKKSK